MVKQEVVWYSVKEDGAPKTIRADCFQLLVKNKRYGWYGIKDAFYNFRLNTWSECLDGMDCTEIKKSEYDILYYTSDLGFRAVCKFFSNIEEQHD